MPKTVEDEIKEYESQIKECENSIEELQEKNDSLRQKFEQLNNEIDQTKTVVFDQGGQGHSFNDNAKLNALEEAIKELDGIAEEIAKNDDLIMELQEKAAEIGEKAAELGEQAAEAAKNVGGLMSEIKQAGEKAIENAATSAVAFAKDSVKSSVKSAASKINPFDKNINKNDVADTGAESIRLANKTIKSGKKGINTVKNSVKTVGRTIKTTERAVKTSYEVVKATGKIAYKTAAFTVRTVIKTVRFTINTLVNIVAFATNPVVLIIAAILILIVIMGAAFILLLGGGSFGSSTNGKAQAGAVGLGDVVTEYDLGKEYFRIAVENSQSNFNSLIDSLYYDYGDLTNSDVIYMERYKDDGNTVIYNRSFPTDYQKEVLKNSWSIALSEKEALAIAYVYLEKQLNDSSNTTRQIYEVTYNQDVFDEILDTCIKFTDNTYNNQACPDLVCTAHYIHNDDYDTAWTNQQGSVNAYNEWGGIMDYIAEWYTIPDGASQSQYWTNNVEWRINNWWYVYSYLVDYYPDSSNQGWDYLDYLGGVCNYYSDILDNTPEYFIEQGCDYVHTLHSVGLTSYSVDDILTALGFDDAYTQWYELTLKGFESNPELS